MKLYKNKIIEFMVLLYYRLTNYDKYIMYNKLRMLDNTINKLLASSKNTIHTTNTNTTYQIIPFYWMPYVYTIHNREVDNNHKPNTDTNDNKGGSC